jgi:hypothetical protein
MCRDVTINNPIRITITLFDSAATKKCRWKCDDGHMMVAAAATTINASGGSPLSMRKQDALLD